MFSKTCEYALRAMIFIASQSKKGLRTGTKTIAAKIDSPDHFIAKILQDLSKKELLLSAKGPNGGFYLDERLLNSSIADIVNAVDGSRLFDGCALGLRECSEKNPCAIHHKFKAIRASLHNALCEAKLADFEDNTFRFGNALNL